MRSVYRALGFFTSTVAMSVAMGGAAYAQEAVSEPAPARAQPSSMGLEEIVVTAQKRSQNLQEIPIAVTAFSDQALTDRGIDSISDLGGLVPGLKVDPGNGITLPFLRGVGSPLTALGNEPSVAMYIDGLYFTRLMPGFLSLNNVERVEVLKGPQGTLFGRNSTGGVIHIITKNPSQIPSLSMNVGYGSFDTFKGDLYATTGLSDDLAIDISLSGRRQGEGYGQNLYDGSRTVYQDDFTARTKLFFTPGDSTEITLTGFYSYSLSGGDATTLPGTIAAYDTPPFDPVPELDFYDQNTDTNGFLRGHQKGGALTIDQDLGFAALKSITGYVRNDEFLKFDLEKTERNDSAATLTVDVEQFTQELQLSSLPGGALQWIVGAFYYDTKAGYSPTALYGSVFVPGDDLTDDVFNGIQIFGAQKTKSWSIFGQATYEIVPDLSVTGGIRYTSDKNRAFGRTDFVVADVPTTLATADVSKKENEVTFKAAIDYQVTPDILTYASFSRGYKTGGFNLIPVDPAGVDPETIEAYEVGIKSELFDRRLRLNVAAFWYDIGSPQVEFLLGSSVATANAGGSRVKGIEFEGTAILAEGLSVNLGATYLEPEYTDFPAAPFGPALYSPPYGTPDVLGTINATGNQTPYASKFTANFAPMYKFASSIGDWALSANLSYNDGYYFEPNNQFKQDSFFLADARVMVRPNDVLSVSIWGKNLFDEKIVALQATQAGFGFPFTPAPPRTYGMTIGFDF